MKATYRYFAGGDALHVYIEDLPPHDPESTDWDQAADWGIDVLVDEELRPLKYEVVRLGDLYQNGHLEMPPGFQEPSHRFEVDDAPGRSFTLQELIAWIHDRVTPSEESSSA